MSRFKTLLHREWMQHHRGWLVLLLLPPLLLLAAAPFSSVQFDPGDGAASSLRTSTGLMLATMVMVPVVVLTLAVAAVAFQAAGLARRDVQDRSIEFWLSLPTSHSASIAAPVLAHFVLLPTAAVAVGGAFGYVLGAAFVGKLFGAGAVAALPWGTLWLAGTAGLIRAVFGVLLGSLWLLPLLLLTMAASAWFKRWGVAVLAIGVSVLHKVLELRYGITAVGDTLTGLLAEAPVAVVHAVSQNPLPPLPDAGDLDAWLAGAPGWLLSDAMASVRELGQPLFLVALAGSALGFGLLVLRRTRSR